MFGIEVCCLDTGYGRDASAKPGPCLWGVVRSPSVRSSPFLFRWRAQFASVVVLDRWGSWLRGPVLLARWQGEKPW